MVYGTSRTNAADLPKLLAERKIEFPVLLDPKRAYRDAMDLAVYPSATLLDRSGSVVWQGQTFWRKRFADACEKQIESALAVRVDEASDAAKR